jgi:hypothetical protein
VYSVIHYLLVSSVFLISEPNDRLPLFIHSPPSSWSLSSSSLTHPFALCRRRRRRSSPPPHQLQSLAAFPDPREKLQQTSMASEEPLDRDTLFRKLRAKSENKVLNFGLWFVIFSFLFCPWPASSSTSG